MSFFSRRRLGLAIIIVVILGFGWYSYYRWFDPFPPNLQMILGVSFSAEQAAWLGLNPAKVFGRLLTDYGFKTVRLAAQWNTLEPELGQFNFDQLDLLMSLSARYQARVMLAVGQKTPRWPECHLPKWVKGLSEGERRAARLDYIRAVVERYRAHPALELWQVENEPFFRWFGDCPKMSQAEFAAELALVKKLDPRHPTLTSDSGELSGWRKTARATDYFGTTLYRVVWNRWIGYWNYDWLPPAFYRAKFLLNGRPLATSFVTELQAEPWLPSGAVSTTPLAAQWRSLDLARLQNNIRYARRVGVARSYLWGAEWWLWLAGQGERGIGEYIKSLPKQ